MKAIGVIKVSEFKTNAHNARALEVMIPCQNNAATCYLKLKNYKDARLLAENVSVQFSTFSDDLIKLRYHSGQTCLTRYPVEGPRLFFSSPPPCLFFFFLVSNSFSLSSVSFSSLCLQYLTLSRVYVHLR